MDDVFRGEGATEIPPEFSWSDFEASVGAQQLALFIDYDGTLTPIAPRPDLANLSNDTRRLLARLAALMPVTVITGRDLSDVKQRVGLDDIVYVGSHGFDIEGPGIDQRPSAASEATRALIARIGSELDRKLGDVPGIILEPKRFSAAVHYRLVAEDRVAPMLDIVNEIAARQTELRVTGGKKLAEIRPVVDWHKGSAVFWVLSARGLDREDVLPLFLGDDVTDEDAFKSLRAAGRGYGIVVCDPPRPSFAHGRVSDTDAVQRLLETLLRWAEARA